MANRLKTLVIAEKKSVGKTLALHLSSKRDHGTWIEGDEHDVTWAQGHLMRLLLPEEYEDHPEWSAKAASLPIDPGVEGWRWKEPAEGGAAAQYACICERLAQGCYSRVINACDPDREGQAIADLVLRHLGCTLPVDRLWCSSLEDAALAKAFARMKPDSDYAGLFESALLRSKADWLVGMNASRLYSRMLRGAQSVGRVRTPTLALVVDRDRAIETFKSCESYKVVLDLGAGFLVSGEPYTEQANADDVLSKAIGSTCSIVSVERKQATEGAPTLLNTTGAQKLASDRFGMSPDECDRALQSLYERKLVTYPRTDSKYVNSEDGAGLEALVALVADAPHVGDAAAKAFLRMPHDVTKVVDDSKVEGHGAILPTMHLDARAIGSLSGPESDVARMVCESLLAAVSPDRVMAKVAVDAMVNGKPYRATSSTEIDPGWKALRRDQSGEDATDGDEAGTFGSSVIPADITEGDFYTVLGGQVKTVKATPPKRFTDATLLAAMEHADRFLEEESLKAAMRDDSSHSGGIGTPATRAGIIASLVERGYLARKGTTLTSTIEGRAIVDAVDPRLKDVALTASFERDLTSVERDGASSSAFMESVSHLVRDVVSSAQNAPSCPVAPKGTPVGRCPACGGSVLDTCNDRAPFVCENTRRERSKGPDGETAWRECGPCTFRLPRTFMGAPISAASAKKLLAGKTAEVKGIERKDGTTVNKKLELDPSQGWRLHIASDQSSKVGVCPKCGGAVLDVGNDKVPYLCEHNNREPSPGETPCDFKMYREFQGKRIPKADVPKLLKGEDVLVKGLVSPRDSKKYDAVLRLDPQRGWRISIVGYPPKARPILAP